MQGEDGRKIRDAGFLQYFYYFPEGLDIIRQVGKIDDAPFVAGDLDDKIGEAASTTGVEEYDGGAFYLKPSCRIITVVHSGNGVSKTLQDRRQTHEPAFL